MPIMVRNLNLNIMFAHAALGPTMGVCHTVNQRCSMIVQKQTRPLTEAVHCGSDTRGKAGEISECHFKWGSVILKLSWGFNCPSAAS